MSPRQGARSYKSREERREEIIAATLAILADEGMHAWTTSALADRVGVSEAAIFKHFESKGEILTAALGHQARELRSRIREYEGNGTAWERVEGLIGHLFAYLERTQGGPMVILMGQASRLQPGMREEVSRTVRLLRDRLAGMVEESLEETGRAGAVDPDTAAEVIHAVMLTSAMRGIILGERTELFGIAGPMLGLVGECIAGGDSSAGGAP